MRGSTKLIWRDTTTIRHRLVSHSSPQSQAWLEFPSGERVFLQDGATSIGRAPTCRIVIATERVSRNHAAIRRTEGGAYELMDLGSSNGTFVNGQRLSRPVALQNGWVIEVGLQKMVFRTPPSLVTGAGTSEAVSVPCWLLTMSAAALGCRTSNDELAGKTYESWTERVQRVVAKHRGRTMRGRDEGLVAFWPVQTADSRASTVATALRSLVAVQRQNEEFRLSLHHGVVTLRPTPTGESSPAGPEVIFALQLDRLASGLKTPLLVTEAAREALAEQFSTRRLGVEEMQGYSGTHRFYTAAE
jgi:pSer/pThr/pTyr-binding forkhead associated (FHA) protein